MPEAVPKKTSLYFKNIQVNLHLVIFEQYQKGDDNDSIKICHLYP